VPVGAAAGLLSDIWTMENQVMHASVGRGGNSTTVRTWGYFDPMPGLPDCQLETAPKQALKRKTLHFYGMTSSHYRDSGRGNYFGNLRVGSEVWSDSRRLNSSPKFGP